MKDFNLFISQLRETNQSLDFFCDFVKIGRNVDDIKLSLCMLNSLIGTSDLRKSVETIWNRDKTAFSVLPILIAVRDEGSKKVLDSLNNIVDIKTFFGSVDRVIEFLENTGLADLFRNRTIKDLVDYVDRKSVV